MNWPFFLRKCECRDRHVPRGLLCLINAHFLSCLLISPHPSSPTCPPPSIQLGLEFQNRVGPCFEWPVDIWRRRTGWSRELCFLADMCWSYVIRALSDKDQAFQLAPILDAPPSYQVTNPEPTALGSCSYKETQHWHRLRSSVETSISLWLRIGLNQDGTSTGVHVLYIEYTFLCDVCS